MSDVHELVETIFSLNTCESLHNERTFAGQDNLLRQEEGCVFLSLLLFLLVTSVPSIFLFCRLLPIDQWPFC